MMRLDWLRGLFQQEESVFSWAPEGGGINVGDHLAHVIVADVLKHRDTAIRRKLERRSRLFAIGSVLHFARNGDCVWGAGVNGKVRADHHRFTRLDVRAVRGPLTQRFLEERGVSCPAVFGDPAVLMPLFYDKRLLGSWSRTQDFVVVPHLNDDPQPYERYGDRVVWPSWHPARFAAALIGARRVVSTSLHGLVLAEAYGVPAVRLDVGGRETEFKYADYYLGSGRDGFATGQSVEECLGLTAPELPRLGPIQERLLRSFPYDLWGVAPGAAAGVTDVRPR